MKRLFISFIILFTATSISFAEPAPDMKDGKWEITTKTEMPGMPMQMPAVTSTQCLTKEDLVPQNSQQGGGGECKITDVKVEGNTVSWTMHCSGQGGEIKGSGEITYSGDSFKGKMNIIMTQANMKMVNTMNGTRIGECE